jgi:hypothetical protein
MCERVCSHFEELWTTLNDRTRATVVVLSLVELCIRAIGSEFDYRSIIQTDVFGAQLRNLRMLGLAERIGPEWPFDRHGLCLWRGEYWTIRSQALVWWVLHEAIAGSPRIHSLSIGAQEGECTSYNLAAVRQILVESFNKEELRMFCFDFGVDYDDLNGEGKAGKALELIGYLDRRGCTLDLIERGKDLRPNARWEDAWDTESTSCGLLPHKQYLRVLTQEQWDQLWDAVRNSSILVNLRIGTLARSLFELLKETRLP